MSEPLSTHEIEDVLSSIRRLVSSELRPSLKPPETTAAVEKLLLTPSLRVVEAAPAAVAAPEPVAKPVAEPAEAEAPMAVVDDEEIQVFFGEAAPLGRSRGREEYDDESEAPAGSGATSGLRLVLDNRAAVPAAEAASAPAVLTLREGARVPEVDWSQGEEDWVEEEPAPAPQIRVTSSQEPLARAWADRAEAQIKEELGREAVRAAEPVSPVGMDEEDADDAWVDEELLRDLVRAIIREELAGTLGERITRNVRKLVRLEVNRALTTRDFD